VAERSLRTDVEPLRPHFVRNVGEQELRVIAVELKTVLVVTHT
jgi:hypothetical protein